MRKLRKNDDVIVISGKDKGKRGTLVFIKKDLVIIEGINLIKKHVKPNPNKQIEGGIVEQESFLHISNVALYNVALNKSDRIGFKYIKNNKNKKEKVRYFKSNNDCVN